MQRRRKSDQVPGAGGPQDVEKYRRAWHSYVARRNLVVVLFMGLVPLGFLIARLKLGEIVSMGVMVSWIAVYLAGAWWLTQWKCPRCGNTFSNRLWTPRCISCGLSKDEAEAVARGK
jgi:hypothetical protein